MSILHKKHIFTHVVIGIILILMIVALVIYPLEIEGRSLVIIQHNNNAQKQNQNVRLSDESRAISNAERQVENASSAVQKSRQDVANAYIPRGEFQSTSRWYDIQQSEEALDRAQRNYREADSSLYLLKRISESNARERRIDDQRRFNHHIKSKIKEPPYQQSDLDDED
ncbi:MAG: hypothetical protein BGO43_09380 [Gammaproteobacteria bacterium 39-13]|nr:hypothetical protein [Gammaproteobacteria bacterium]OJV93853.1 MAG: hypothetical protein BGO43_09380 [Gammaproteobacteria bacterium 39-13]